MVLVGEIQLLAMCVSAGGRRREWDLVGGGWWRAGVLARWHSGGGGDHRNLMVMPGLGLRGVLLIGGS